MRIRILPRGPGKPQLPRPLPRREAVTGALVREGASGVLALGAGGGALVREGAGGALAVCLLALAPLPLLAQGSEVSIEVGGSAVTPPLGVEGETARFLVAGLRALHFNPGGTGIHASLLTGLSAEDGTGGDFYSGLLEGALKKAVGDRWSTGLELRAFGFRVVEPFPYRSLGLEGGPTIRFTSGKVSATLKAVGGVGWSKAELVQYTDDDGSRSVRLRRMRLDPEPPVDDTPTVLEDDLWRYGATAEVLGGLGRIMGGLALGLHQSAGGSYRSAGLRLLSGGSGKPTVELRVDAWDTPLGTKTTGGLAFLVPVRGWSLRGFLGRTEPDPLTMAEPGGGAGGILLGRRLAGRDPLPPTLPPLHEVLGESGGMATVRIHVRGPEGSQRMELLGDFTFWEPVQMTREGEEWVVEVTAPIGTHHFGFLADGTWYLPEDAPDAVPDEWGRKNATLVIEG